MPWKSSFSSGRSRRSPDKESVLNLPASAAISDMGIRDLAPRLDLRPGGSRSCHRGVATTQSGAHAAVLVDILKLVSDTIVKEDTPSRLSSNERYNESDSAPSAGSNSLRLTPMRFTKQVRAINARNNRARAGRRKAGED